jgi:hypothetical protein
VDPNDLISGSEVRSLLGGISEKTLARYRRNYWFEGAHYIRPVQKTLYIKPLILDWAVNGKSNPVAHQEAIERWLREIQPPKQPGTKRKLR